MGILEEWVPVRGRVGVGLESDARLLEVSSKRAAAIMGIKGHSRCALAHSLSSQTHILFRS